MGCTLTCPECGKVFIPAAHHLEVARIILGCVERSERDARLLEPRGTKRTRADEIGIAPRTIEERASAIVAELKELGLAVKVEQRYGGAEDWTDADEREVRHLLEEHMREVARETACAHETASNS